MRGSKRPDALSMVISVSAGASRPCSLRARRSRTLSRLRTRSMYRSSTALQLRDEQGLLDGGIEFVDQLAGAAVTAQRDCAEPLAGKLPKAFFCERDSVGVRNIELVTGIARAIHYNLDGHFFTLLLTHQSSSVLSKTSDGNQVSPPLVVLKLMSNACKIAVILRMEMMWARRPWWQ